MSTSQLTTSEASTFSSRLEGEMKMRPYQEAQSLRNAEVSLLRVADVQSDDVDAWKVLARQALDPNPFFEPEFVLPLEAARRQDDVHLLVLSEERRWLFCMPVVVRWGWRKMPVPVLSTWLSQYTFLGTPLVAADRPDALLKLLQNVGAIHSGLLLFEWVGGHGSVSSHLAHALSECHSPIVLWERFERAAVRPSLNEGLHISSRRKAELARRRRALERELGASVTLVDRTDDPTAVDEFLALEASGWKGRERTAIASNPSDREFFHQICSDLAAAGRMRMLALTCSRTVAMQCNFVADGILFGFRTCYDESLSRFSPGALLLQDAIEDSRIHGGVWFDSCTAPDNDLCNRLMPDREQIETFVVGRPSTVGSMLIVTMRAAAFLRRTRIQMRERGVLKYRHWLGLERKLRVTGP